MKVLTCQQSRELEERAVRSGCTLNQLMNNAGSSVAGYIRSCFDTTNKNIVILCGRGNNGGDGFVIADRLCDLCASMTVILTDGQPSTELSVEKFAQLEHTNTEILSYDSARDRSLAMVEKADLIVDAIYGIGFHGEIKAEMYPLFQKVDASNAAVIAVDIPSGLNGDSGRLPRVYMKADVTITFSTYKPVHVLLPAKTACGIVEVSNIGIGSNCIADQPNEIFVTQKEMIRQFIGQRDEEGHKGTFGRLLAVCGSYGMAGAAVLASSAALRSGVGLVDVALPEKIYPIVGSSVTEAVFTILDESAPGPLMDQMENRLAAASACLIGCGLGRSQKTDELVYQLIEHSRVPLIIDADGINAVAEKPDILRLSKVPVILTPHPGEFARLLHKDSRELLKDRITPAKQFAEDYGVILVLKGHNTLIVPPVIRESGSSDVRHKIAYNMTGNSGLAKGGSGDVLAGMIAGLCAQGMGVYEAACTGVYLHGKAGDRAAMKYSKHGMLPSHLLPEFETIFKEYEEED